MESRTSGCCLLSPARFGDRLRIAIPIDLRVVVVRSALAAATPWLAAFICTVSLSDRDKQLTLICTVAATLFDVYLLFVRSLRSARAFLIIGD